jgi:phospholipase C
MTSCHPLLGSRRAHRGAITRRRGRAMSEVPNGVTRRQALRNAGVAGLGAAAAGSGIEALLAAAATAAPKAGALKDIDHVVILMQENRSFDHYFGTLSGVRGFDDRQGRAAFTQLDSNGKRVHPFRLPKYCFPDLTHEWGPQHSAWNHGRMDRFLRVHEAVDAPPGTGIETMGYYTRADLGFYYALADAFTICDGYHCSVIGPTDPNRLMSMSATIDPAGTHGGPLLHTNVAGRTGLFSWTTMPERLQAHGVDWKVYQSPAGGNFDNVLTYFKQYTPGSELYKRGIGTTYPVDFMNDLDQDRLPKVSWVLTGITETEHPGFSSAVAGEIAARQVLEALVSHPKIWERTALFITWDENGGFFDHVAPPTAPKGTSGEYLTVATPPSDADGFRGPIGLGFRVPMLVVSPFSRGGLVCSDTFDHTSTLRFLETRFGVRVPNLSSWRRKATGDLTSAFNFAAAPRTGVPSLPQPDATTAVCAQNTPVTVPSQPFPKQERGKRRRPSGIVKKHR